MKPFFIIYIYIYILTYKTEVMDGLNIYETGLPSPVRWNLLFSLNWFNIASILSRTEQLQSLNDVWM